jgi:hypothetical protein
MMIERPAAANALGDDNLASVAGQKPDRRIVDLGRENLLGAARKKRHAAHALLLAFEDLRAIQERPGRQLCRR